MKVTVVGHFVFVFVVIIHIGQPIPMVINTWPVPNATAATWNLLLKNASAVDAVVGGCSECEAEQCRHMVGAGGNPDESGETTLDAMIMDGKTMSVGAVGCLRRVKTAIAVAKAVMDYSEHTLLVGDLATKFALEMGFKESNLTTPYSLDLWKQWRNNKCQPNFRQNVDPSSNCGPYTPAPHDQSDTPQVRVQGLKHGRDITGMDNHDTIGMIAIDSDNNISAGTSTNGLSHKVPGRVGDSPIMGAGAYAENGIGASVATGNGDIMMRFLPTFNAVRLMKQDIDPTTALKQSLAPIIRFYPTFHGAMLAVNAKGKYGAACYGYPYFTYCLANPSSGGVHMFNITCMS